MHDPGIVRGFETACNLPREAQRIRDRQLAVSAQDAREIRALHVRHRDVLDAVDFPEIVNPHDMFVRHLTGKEQLVLEALFDLSRNLPLVAANHFQRNRDTQLRVPRLIDRAHAARAEQFDHVIPGTECAYGERTE